jgi:sulfur carrier protein
MQIHLNGKTLQLESSCCLADFLQNHVDANYSSGQLAIAINLRVVTRNKYTSTWLQEGDKVEILLPAQGG